MSNGRPPKKSEILEIRLSHAAKVAFMQRCRAAGLTASEVVRDLIDQEAPRPRRTMKRWQAALLAVAGLVIGAAAAPSIAQALPGSRATFDQLDADRDGVISFAEFRAR